MKVFRNKDLAPKNAVLRTNLPFRTSRRLPVCRATGLTSCPICQRSYRQNRGARVSCLCVESLPVEAQTEWPDGCAFTPRDGNQSQYFLFRVDCQCCGSQRSVRATRGTQVSKGTKPGYLARHQAPSGREFWRSREPSHSQSARMTGAPTLSRAPGLILPRLSAHPALDPLLSRP